jgi:Dihydro-orotase-like
MRKLLQYSLFLGFFLATNTAFSQQDWRWDGHGVGFSAPANLRVTTNNASEFTAEGSDLFLSIYVEQDGEVSEETLADALVVAAKEMEYDEISDVDALEVDDFTGYYVEGKKDGVGAFIITLLDKKSATNLVVVLVFTNDTAREKAIEVATSFYAFD